MAERASMESDPIGYFTQDLPDPLVPLVDEVAGQIDPEADISETRALVADALSEPPQPNRPVPTASALQISNIALAARLKARASTKKGRTK